MPLEPVVGRRPDEAADGGGCAEQPEPDRAEPEALVGGLLARAWGVTAPFWFGFAGSAVILALIWRQLAHIAHVGDEAEEVAERV